jgi:hypothetical protein
MASAASDAGMSSSLEPVLQQLPHRPSACHPPWKRPSACHPPAFCALRWVRLLEKKKAHLSFFSPSRYIGDNQFIAGIFTILVIPDNQLSPYRG